MIAVSLNGIFTLLRRHAVLAEGRDGLRRHDVSRGVTDRDFQTATFARGNRRVRKYGGPLQRPVLPQKRMPFGSPPDRQSVTSRSDGHRRHRPASQSDPGSPRIFSNREVSWRAERGLHNSVYRMRRRLSAFYRSPPSGPFRSPQLAFFLPRLFLFRKDRIPIFLVRRGDRLLAFAPAIVGRCGGGSLAARGLCRRFSGRALVRRRRRSRWRGIGFLWGGIAFRF